MSSTPHLWEVDHPYYCNEGNFHINGQCVPFGSWTEFMEEGWGQSDHDLNLLFRWDWQRADPADYGPDEEIPGDRLVLFFMLQRKGDFWSVEVAVTEADEPAVRGWLTDRAKTIAAIWSPISVVQAMAS